MRRDRMRRKITELHARLEDSWTFASDKLFQESMDAYFVFEEHLTQVGQVLLQLEAEIEAAGDADETLLRRISGRLDFLEEHFEEIDSGARNRPRRRRRRFSFTDFFRTAAGDGDDLPPSEVASLTEAYQILGVGHGAEMRTVTTVFRRLVKELHPDARGGDRSTEPRLRKVVAAYEFLKRNGKAAR
jgi:hypothetical protein